MCYWFLKWKDLYNVQKGKFINRVSAPKLLVLLLIEDKSDLFKYKEYWQPDKTVQCSKGKVYQQSKCSKVVSVTVNRRQKWSF